MSRAAELRRPRTVVLLAAAVALAGAGGYVAWSRAKTAELLRRGEEALAARDYPKAREYLDRYLTERPGDTHARLLAARTARRMRNYTEARQHLRRCREDGGEAEPIVVEEALIDLQQGNPSPVLFLRDRATRDDDLALVILEVLIQHDLDTYQLAVALDEYTRYLKHRPDDLQALMGRGYVWERFLYFSDALADYQKAVAAHPDHEPARLKLADTLLIVGTPEEALEQYRWLAERSPDRVEVRLGLARCHRRLAQPEEAAKLLDGILKEDPEHTGAIWERGELELQQGRPAEAEPLLRRAAGKLPYDQRVHYAMYRCLLQLNRPKEAEAYNARASQLDAEVRRLNELRLEVMKRPNDAALRCEGGLLFLRLGEREEGRRWLQLALRLDPKCEAARSALTTDPLPPPKLP
jgi:tetratricopeptide (TPR) repeat protein